MEKTSWHWWWGWNPEDIETWLEAMERGGWNLVHVGFLGVRFRFRGGECRQVRYCVDYQNNPDAEYHSLLADDGWHLVWRELGWHLWQKPYVHERPNIFTDMASLVQRNRRLSTVLDACAAAELCTFAAIVPAHLSGLSPLQVAFYGVWAALTGVILMAAWKVHRHSRRMVGFRVKSD